MPIYCYVQTALPVPKVTQPFHLTLLMIPHLQIEHQMVCVQTNSHVTTTNLADFMLHTYIGRSADSFLACTYIIIHMYIRIPLSAHRACTLYVNVEQCEQLHVRLVGFDFFL